MPLRTLPRTLFLILFNGAAIMLWCSDCKVCMCYLIQEKELFVIFKMRGAAEVFRYDKARVRVYKMTSYTPPHSNLSSLEWYR